MNYPAAPRGGVSDPELCNKKGVQYSPFLQHHIYSFLEIIGTC